MTLILSPNLRRSTNPAQMSISGGVSNGSDWVETLTIVDSDGAQVTGVGSDTWVIQLRDDPDDTAADLTLSTDDDLTITVGASSTTLAIASSASTMSALDAGDYTIDIASQTAGGVTTHRGHGRITVSGSPIAI